MTKGSGLKNNPKFVSGPNSEIRSKLAHTRRLVRNRTAEGSTDLRNATTDPSTHTASSPRFPHTYCHGVSGVVR